MRHVQATPILPSESRTTVANSLVLDTAKGRHAVNLGSTPSEGRHRAGCQQFTPKQGSRNLEQSRAPVCIFHVEVISGVLCGQDHEEELEQRINEAKQSVHECLLDNINTAGAIEALVKLVNATNKYIKHRETNQGGPTTGGHIPFKPQISIPYCVGPACILYLLPVLVDHPSLPSPSLCAQSTARQSQVLQSHTCVYFSSGPVAPSLKHLESASQFYIKDDCPYFAVAKLSIPLGIGA